MRKRRKKGRGCWLFDYSRFDALPPNFVVDRSCELMDHLSGNCSQIYGEKRSGLWIVAVGRGMLGNIGNNNGNFSRKRKIFSRVVPSVCCESFEIFHAAVEKFKNWIESAENWRKFYPEISRSEISLPRCSRIALWIKGEIIFFSKICLCPP